MCNVRPNRFWFSSNSFSLEDHFVGPEDVLSIDDVLAADRHVEVDVAVEGGEEDDGGWISYRLLDVSRSLCLMVLLVGILLALLADRGVEGGMVGPCV